MKTAILLMILLFPSWAYCQAKDSTFFRRLSIGVSYSPDLCFRQLKYSQTNDWVSDYRNEEEVPKFGFTIGLNFRYHLNTKFIFETGLLYADKGFQTKETTILWVNPSSELPTKSKTEFQFRYLEIPVGLNYVINSSRVRYYISAGAIVSRFLAKRTILKLEYANGNSSKIGSTQELGYDKFNLSVAVGFGLTYQLSKRFSFDIEPVYRQGITSITGDKNAGEYLYTLGLSTTVYYTFKKRNR